MNAQPRFRFKPEPARGAGLPVLDPEQRGAIRRLPIDLVRGIARLYQQPAPRVTKPDVWPVIVADALYLATTGWALDALALGWHPLELFGCVAAVDGDDNRLGLAGRLDGRDIVRISEEAALLQVAAAPVILRRNSSFEGTTYLWEYGR